MDTSSDWTDSEIEYDQVYSEVVDIQDNEMAYFANKARRRTDPFHSVFRMVKSNRGYRDLPHSLVVADACDPAISVYREDGSALFNPDTEESISQRTRLSGPTVNGYVTDDNDTEIRHGLLNEKF